jgi:hypothetical protein
VRFLKFVYSMENSDEDTFKILLATDVHLGYGEANPIRGTACSVFIYFARLCMHF